MTSQPGDPATLLATTFDDAGPVDQLVGFGPIEFASICEHHLLPFTGLAWVAYIPDGRVIGLSKVARLIEHYARRPQVQERLTGQITAALDKHVASLGSACQIRATHTCASMRGVRKETPMTTSSLTGAFRTDLAAREEYLSFLAKER
jgi:GTP cyclohydrolase I